MCVRVTCDQCGKPSYSGCGAHVEQVLAGVPRDQRCRCREERVETTAPKQRSLRERLFGK